MREHFVRALTAGQRAVARSGRGPARVLWRSVYSALSLLYTAYVCRGAPSASAYVRGSVGGGDPAYGISDIDVVFVVAGDDAVGVRDRLRLRAERLARIGPVRSLFDYPAFFEQADLQAAAGQTALTRGLDGPAGAVYAGPRGDIDLARLLERPQLFAATRGWQRLRGLERRPSEVGHPEHRTHAAWLELQYWWRCAFEGALSPGSAWIAPLCAKLVAEPARIWLWLARGEDMAAASRAQVLARAAEELPGEQAALELALKLDHEAGATRNAPLGDCLAALLRLSQLIAAELSGQAAAAGSTSVRLVHGELALPHGGWPAGSDPGAELLPLADWPALVCPLRADDASALLDGNPADPDTLAAAARVFVTSAKPALRAGDLTIRPIVGGLARMRTIQSPLTDPVSFALEAGDAQARFSAAHGWSAHDWARRAVAERSAWLDWEVKPDGRSLGLLALAARAALFNESLEAGEPALALTASAALRLLGERVDGAGPVVERAWEEYRRHAVDWNEVPPEVVRDLERIVRLLPAYARERS